MPFQKIHVPRASSLVVAQIERLILDGTLLPGQKIPPERELAEQLNVSRPTLREALTTLETRGMLQSKRGEGTTVCELFGESVIDPLMQMLQSQCATHRDILELRDALESSAAYYAALRHTPSDAKIMQQKLAALEHTYDTGDVDHEGECDTAFHMAVAYASHNPALLHVMRSLFVLLRSEITENLNSLRHIPEDHTQIKQQHRGILNAVLSGDPDAARHASSHHLQFISNHFETRAQTNAREQNARRRQGLG